MYMDIEKPKLTHGILLMEVIKTSSGAFLLSMSINRLSHGLLREKITTKAIEERG